MKNLATAVGLAALTVTAASAETGSMPSGPGRGEAPISAVGPEAPRSPAVTVSEAWAQATGLSNRALTRSRALGRGATMKEPFVKDAHPRGPSWVNSPRGVGDRGQIRVNPAVNVRRVYQRNLAR